MGHPYVYIVALMALIIAIHFVAHRHQARRRALDAFALEQMPIAIFMGDANLRLVYAGGRALSDAGLDGSNLIGANIIEVVDEPKLVEAWKKALNGHEVLLYHAGGVLAPKRRYATRAVPVRGHHRVRVVVTTIEVTNLYHFDERVTSTLAKLRNGGHA